MQTLAATAERLVKRGHRVWVAATDSNLTERLDVDTEIWHKVDGVSVRYFRTSDSWTKRLPTPYFQKSMADYRTPDLEPWLRESNLHFDIIHSQLPFIHGNRVCSRFAQDNWVPYFYSQHGVFDPVKLQYRGLKKRLYLQMHELSVCRRAAVLLGLTEHERESYRKLGLKNRVEIIPNGIDLPEPQHFEWPFPHFPIREGAPLVLLIGRLHPMKGADLALEAFLLARKTAPEARLIIAGPDEHGLMEKLKSRAAETSAADAVLFPGAVQGSTKAALLTRANIFMLPTLSEGFSVSILEAMASGCAIVTTKGAYFPEIEQAGAGWICERDAISFGGKLASLMCQPGEVKRTGERARALVAKDYSWDSVVSRLEALYAEVSEKALGTAA